MKNIDKKINNLGFGQVNHRLSSVKSEKMTHDKRKINTNIALNELNAGITPL